MMSTVELLRQVGAFPLDATLEDVKELAETIWYQGYMPSDTELDQVRGHLSREGFQRLLCVLELLSQYPVCPRDSARRLQRLAGFYHALLLGNESKPAQGRYSPSKRWQISDQTTVLRKALLPIQTRSYADSTGASHGFG